MDLSWYAARLHAELMVAAGAGDAAVAAAAERLSSALDAGFRLTLLEALAEATEEITRELAPGSVEVRLRGREPEFVVNPPPAEFVPSGMSNAAPPGAASFGAVGSLRPTEADDPTARLTLRLPEHLKQQVESVAAAEGLSVNAWLVRTVAGALNQNDPSGPGEWPTGRHHLRGWVR